MSDNQTRKVILEYVAPDGGDRIYGFGNMSKDGTVERSDDDTFGPLPSGEYPVLKADGTLVSNDDYCTLLESSN